MNRTVSRTATLLNPSAILLRLEGIVVLIGAITLYFNQSASSLMFLLLFFVPDLSMVGYLVNPRIGSLTYNAVHSYVLPGVLLVLTIVAHWAIGTHIALIWLAHIGMDRLFGFGLKYPTSFKDTHLQRV